MRPRHILAAAAAVGIAALLLFALSMRRGLNHDEHQFVAGAALLAREGLLPYRDFAWFHMPTLLFLYAALFRLSDQLLLTARALSVAGAAASGALLLGVALRAPRSAPPASARAAVSPALRLGIGALVLLLLITSAAYLHAAGRAWNHDLPIALALAATLALVRAPGQREMGRALVWSALAGLLLGLAVGIRLTFAPLALPFAIAPWLWPGGTRRRLAVVAALGGGMLVGLAPTLYSLLLAPDAFFFGNLRYAQLNTLYYRALAAQGAGQLGGLTLPAKLLDAGRFLLQPANLPLLLFAALALWRSRAAWLGRPGSRRAEGEPPARELRLWLLLLPFLLVGALAPTPMQMQYVYVLFPFLALGLLWALRHDARPGALLPWLAGAALITTALALPRYAEGLAILPNPAAWTPRKVHTRGALMTQLATSSPNSGTAQAGGPPTILTLAPIDPLEGGARIDPRLATGPFGWRVAPFVDAETRARYGLFGPEELAVELESNPPRALFSGLQDGDADAEAQLVAWAVDHAYTAAPMPDEGVLHLSPLARWPQQGATVRLAAHTLPNSPLQPGASAPFELYLASDGPTASNLNLLVRATNFAGAELLHDDGWPFGAATSAWQANTLWRDGHTLRLPADAAPGLVRVEALLYDPQAGAAAAPTTVGWLQIAPASPPAAPPATFGNALALLAVDAPATAQPGQNLEIALTWQVVQTPVAPLTLFAHLVPGDSAQGNSAQGDSAPAAQADAPPLAGFAPTNLWPAGLVQADALALRLPAELAPGPYTLLLGLYDPATQQRLPVNPPAANDAFAAAAITVAAP